MRKCFVKTGILLVLLCAAGAFVWFRLKTELRPQILSEAAEISNRADIEGRELALGTGNMKIIGRSEKIKDGIILCRGRELAEFALSLEGSKYLYGGKSPEKGFDCSGLVYYVYDHFGYTLNRVASDQAKQGMEVGPDELQPGDVLCFYNSPNYVGHVGIYLEDGWYIHALGKAYGVVKSSLDDPFLQREFTARRILGCTELLKDASGIGQEKIPHAANTAGPTRVLYARQRRSK